MEKGRGKRRLQLGRGMVATAEKRKRNYHNMGVTGGRGAQESWKQKGKGKKSQ